VKRTLSVRGAALIADHEGKVNTLYDDPAGHCTIGIGHLVHRGGCDGSEPAEFRHGLSDQQVYDLFIADAQRFIDAVNGLLEVEVSQNQFDALVSFAFNVGAGALEGSTLLRKLNAGDSAGAAQEFGKWVKADGRTLPGLVRRRTDEARLFLTPDDDQEPPVAGLDHLHPVFAERVANACRARGTSVYSGARSTERQGQLYEDFLAGRGNPANPPGTSWHEYGAGMAGGAYALAVDFAEPYPHGEPGLIFPIDGEPWHAQPSEIPEPRRTHGAELRLPAATPPPHPEEPEVSTIAYPLQVDAGDRRRLPIVAIGGGFGWTRASVTFASTGVEVRRAVVGPNERSIEHLSPAGVESSKRFDGRWYVDLQPGDEWIEVDLGTSPAGTLDLYVEAADD
jgi:GH24 family phage-related lysozyme (muramidase)